MLDLSSFKLQRITLEIRYDNAFLIWDHAGIITRELSRNFPELKLKGQPQPNLQSAELGPGLSSSVLIDKAFIVSIYPTHSLEEFRVAADFFFSVVIRFLEISDLTRIGMRLIHEKKFETRDDVAKFLASSLPMLNREGDFFSVSKGGLKDADLSLRWEGDSTGCLVRIQSQDQKVEIDIPAEFRDVNFPEVKRTAAIADIDYYAHLPTPVTKFRASAIIENWTKVVRRDLGSFLGD